MNRRALALEALLAALLLIAAWLEHARTGVELRLILLGALLAPAHLRRLAGRTTPTGELALEVVAVLGALLVYPVPGFALGTGLVLALRGIVDLARALGLRRVVVARCARKPILGLALAFVIRFLWDESGPVLVLALGSVLALATRAQEPPRGRASLRRGFARWLLLALALVAPARVPWDTLWIALAGSVLLAWPAVRRLPRRLDPIAAGAVALLAWDGAQSARSLLPIVLSVAILAVVATRALAPRKGLVPALAGIVLALHVAADGVFRWKRGAQDLVLGSTAPLVAIGSSDLLVAGEHARLDTREHSFTPRKPAGSYRVALLGGSSAWGHAQKNRPESLAGRLEARLGARLPGVEVVCLAFPGATSDQELGAVVGAATLGWEVDLYLAIDDYNDLTYLAGRDAYPGDVYCWPQHRNGLASPFARAALARARWLAPAFNRWLVLPPWSDERLRPDAANAFWLEGLVANEEAIATIASTSGARFAWASVPLVFDRRVLGPNEAGARDARPEPQRGEVARRSSGVRTRVGPAVRARQGVVLDLAARIAARSERAASETWFVDECHYSDRGMDVLAEETVAALVQAGVVP